MSSICQTPWPRADKTNLHEHRFESFKVSPENQFTFDMARRVAKAPGSFANPLIIYGEHRTGKTHLLQAIGHEIRTSFEGKHPEADVVLIDEVSVLAFQYERQKVFLRRFAECYDLGRQLVVASCVHPLRMPGITDRLRDRLLWGLVVELRPFVASSLERGVRDAHRVNLLEEHPMLH